MMGKKKQDLKEMMEIERLKEQIMFERYSFDLRIAAGIAQRRAGTASNLKFRTSYWNEPRNQRMINKGMRDYRKNRWRFR